MLSARVRSLWRRGAANTGMDKAHALLFTQTKFPLCDTILITPGSLRAETKARGR